MSTTEYDRRIIGCYNEEKLVKKLEFNENCRNCPRRKEDMEWLPILVITILVAILGLYYIVKRAVKDALKEYFGENDKS